MTTSLRDKVAKLASENPELRKHLVPLLRNTKTSSSISNSLEKLILQTVPRIPGVKGVRLLKTHEWDYQGNNLEILFTVQMLPSLQNKKNITGYLSKALYKVISNQNFYKTLEHLGYDSKESGAKLDSHGKFKYLDSEKVLNNSGVQLYIRFNELQAMKSSSMKQADAPEYDFLEYLEDQISRIPGVISVGSSDMDSWMIASVKVGLQLKSLPPVDKGKTTTYTKAPVRPYKEFLKDIKYVVEKPNQGFVGSIRDSYKNKPKRSQSTDFGYKLVNVYYSDELELEISIRPV